MPYNPPRISDVSTLDDLRQVMQEELEKISKEFNETIALDLRTVHQEPKRPRDGMIVSADGTDWNPGSGAGAYEYVGGNWRRVSGIVDGDYGDISISGGVWTIDNDVVSFAKIENVDTARILGRITAGSGDIEELTGTQATTLLDTFTSLLKGLVPASGGGTINFLRADGAFSPVSVLQVLQDTYTTHEAITAQIPHDDTVPQSTEGTEILSQAITPSKTTNKVLVTVSVWGTLDNVAAFASMAVFRGTTCINASQMGLIGSGSEDRAQVGCSMTILDSPSSTSAQTYSVRVGNSDGTTTLSLNGLIGSRLFGGASACTLTVMEING